MKRFSLIMMALAGCAASAVAEDLYEVAMAKLKEQNYRTAKPLLVAHLDKHGESPKVFYALGVCEELGDRKPADACGAYALALEFHLKLKRDDQTARAARSRWSKLDPEAAPLLGAIDSLERMSEIEGIAAAERAYLHGATRVLYAQLLPHAGITPGERMRSPAKAPQQRSAPVAPPSTMSSAGHALEFNVNARLSDRHSVVVPTLKDPGGPLTMEFWTWRHLLEDKSKMNFMVCHAWILGFDKHIRVGTSPCGAFDYRSYRDPRRPYSLGCAGNEYGRKAPVHVAVVRDPVRGELRFYIGGRLAKQLRAPMLVGSGSLEICSQDYQWGRKMKLGYAGWIDEVRISKVVRYNDPFTPQRRFEPDADTLALYHVDEGIGKVLRDASGNNHHGRITGCRWVSAELPPGSR